MNAIAPEGYPFILAFAVVTVVVYLIGGTWPAFFPFLLTLFMLYFFRDPERTIPEGENIFVAPADGKVILVQNVQGNQIPSLLKGKETEFIEIGIFMSPLDVHVNRAPCDGVVESVVHTSGRFLSAFKHEASLQNENIAMVLTTSAGEILVRQVAGFLARRAVCRVKTGESLKKGQRYGIIKFSSRVDTYLPRGSRILVTPGDRVKAGETVIGEM